jgi:phospholipid-binding lipoprotein MlaA
MLSALAACSEQPPAPTVAVAAASPAAPIAVPDLAGGPLVTAGADDFTDAPASSAPVAIARIEPEAPPAAAPAAAPAAELADASTPGLPDPLQPINRQLFKVNNAVERVVDKIPVGKAARVVPAPAVKGVVNLIQNLDEPQAFANNLLQLHPGVALESAARFVINSTVGIAGLFDVAKKVGLQHSGADFGQTLASYGVKPGPYLYVPFLGPSSVRQVVGDFVDGYFWPVHWVSMGLWQGQAVGVARAGFEQIKPPPEKSPLPAEVEFAAASTAPARPVSARVASPDPYLAARAAYLASLPPTARPILVLHHKPAASPPPSAPLPATVLAANP